MIYVVDTHILIWFLDKNKRLSSVHRNILVDKSHKFVISSIVLAEIKHLVNREKIDINFEDVIDSLSNAENCVIYPIDEDIVESMPKGFEIHDSLILATGLVYKTILKEDVTLITEDKEMIQSDLMPVV